MMRAIVQYGYGAPDDVLKLAEVDSSPAETWLARSSRWEDG